VENALDAALEGAAGRGRVFADLWDAERLRNSACAACFTPRVGRLARMNLGQTVEPRIACGCRETGDRA
jgi:hypothetical protein